MSLPLDVSRCYGRFEFDGKETACPSRETCRRFTALADDEQLSALDRARRSYAQNLYDRDGTCRARLPIDQI